MSAHLDHVRSFEELHALINGVVPGATRDAAANLVSDVENAVEEIENHTQIILSAVQSKAEEAGGRIDAEAAATVSNIKKETTAAAATLLRRSHKGVDEKSAARAAGKMLEEASILSKELDRRSNDALALISREEESAANGVNGLRDDAIRDLAEIAQNAINRLSDERDDTSRKGHAPGLGDDRFHVRIEATRVVLANAKRAIDEAAEKVNRTVEQAYERLNNCAKDAIERVEDAAQEATAAIERAVDEANGKLLEATEIAVSGTAAAGGGDHFNLDALKKKWAKKRR